MFSMSTGKGVLPAILLLLLSLTTTTTTTAQSITNVVWAFGDKAGLDFSTGSPVPVTTEIYTIEGSASVSDNSGQLLFYTDGNNIWDRMHDPMPNGSNIINTTTPTSSTSQGAVIVAIPDTPGKFYIFSLTSFQEGALGGRLYYSVVNMNLNGTLGDIEPGRKGILMDSLLSEKMTAVAGNQCNIWLLVHERNTVQYKAYEITNAGISSAPVVSSGIISTPALEYSGGLLKVAPNRQRLAATWSSGGGGVELCDFNPATGVVSNAAVLGLPFSKLYGLCFSPDNSKLYVTTLMSPPWASSNVSQYDISLGTTAAIIASNTSIHDGAFGDLKAGPDGKIYIPAWQNTDVDVINAPNVAGTACSYSTAVLSLAASTQAILGLPNEVVAVIPDTVVSSKDTLLCFSATVDLQADANGWSFLWDNGQTGPQRTVTTPGTYYVRYHLPPCRYRTDTFHVRLSFPVPVTGTAYHGCNGAAAGLAWAVPVTGDTTAYTYTWRNAAGTVLQVHNNSTTGDTLSGLLPGSYTLHIDNHKGCDTLLSLVINSAVVSASFTVPPGICIGSPLNFQNTSTGPVMQYTWYFDDGNTATSTNATHTYAQPGTYQVMLVAATDVPCYDTAYATVQVDSVTAVSFTPNRDSICAGAGIVFEAGVVNADTLRWDFGDGSGTLGLTGPVHAYDSNGSYIITLRGSSLYCPDSVYRDTVHVFPFPVVDLGPDTSICLNGQPIELYNRAAQPADYRSAWSTGDTGTHILVRHHGLFTLQVTSERGCRSVDTVEVLKSCYIDIPNAFTPNGDGVNDYFFPRQLLSKQLSSFTMQVFNRWGQLIFETDRTDGRGWDGRYNNEPQPQGVYIYLIRAGINGQWQEEYKGNVSLLR